MKRRKSKILSLLLIVSLFVGMVGIVNVDTTYAASKKIHLKKKTVSLVVGKTYQQKLIAKNGKTIKATKVKWKSSNKKIAKINKKGKITAVKIGTVKMTAKYRGKTYKFTVKIKKPYKAGDRPRHFEIIDYTKTMNKYFLKWDGFEYGKYEIYISKNGNPYTLYDTTEEYYYDIYTTDLGPGTYSIKIRGKYKNYYSDFSRIQTIVIREKFNVTFDTALPLAFSDGQAEIYVTDSDVSYYEQETISGKEWAVFLQLTGSFSGIDYQDFDINNGYVELYDDNNNLVESQLLHCNLVSYDNTFKTTNSIYIPKTDLGHYRFVIRVK